MSRRNRQQVSLPSPEQVSRAYQQDQYRKRYKRAFISTLSVLAVIAAVAVLVSTLFLPVIQVSGNSMEPTLSDGDVLVLLKSKSYERSQLCCISWQNKMLLKRVIGLPGDVVSIDTEGNVTVNGVLLDEPYVSDKTLGECDVTFPCQVPEGKVFVLGDHRSTSIDSRSSEIGCVDQDQIVGFVLFQVWPIGG
ncbi:signal peptidase I [Ruminococcus champanellensis]|uniref:Signal peptidase I n=1 Tax=Ruminococcus champanellensis (strain DSM 18848 / JCM 17042 / KCTC 15320 / 18P13) TaxID=213810 RepID=D4LAX0_RUMC1|nr:signal peptidase I [Ruminococcus champanellensis]CBL16765.1 signal peptidase I, bacterial type [Ruminococcus champanellensis 18P13 = JCM 17042]